MAGTETLRQVPVEAPALLPQSPVLPRALLPPHVLPPALHPLYLQVFKPIVWVRAILRSGLDVIGEIRFEIWCLLLEMQSNRYLGTSKLPQH